ncbi:uncharacterized protein LOC116774793 [Danaus plexippus]|uniref:RNA polymerase 1 transcription factor subunit Spp27 n=1 Tax=Danaus plexippus plexippus TaxID=278856 RepID=A0A212EV87_DANPL|nr:uncharacterized protein LOC116774793 [Danaus plexippus]OWR45364.1 RNA polymerase 1 transcription factor subunit Spp27 [Danaus plexippus plexippus]
MADVSKEDLEREIEKILKNANLANTSTKKVIQKLEKVFDTDLSEKKKVIDQLVMDYVNSKNSEDEYDEEDDDEEEEEEKKPAKRSAPASKASNKKSRKDSSDEDDDASGDSESEEEKKPAPKKGKKKKGSSDSDSDWGKKKEKAAKPKKGGGRKGGGYTRAYKLSPALSELMGETEMPRHEVVKRVWTIIKEKNLYDPNNKQFAICDDALYKVIGTKRFRTFGMMKYLKTHFLDD